MQNLLEAADLDSPLLDLTTVPLTELRTLTSSALVEALERTYATAAFTTGNERQDQEQFTTGNERQDQDR